MKSLLSSLLDSNNIVPHSISYRVKEKDSLSKKIEKKDKYESIVEITDIIGLRIIVNYSDEVDSIAEILEKEFNIDTENTIDKRATLDPDRFGYLSLHYVGQLNKERVKLIEYKRYKELKFEIQIRSILQHTWAEIEHDIGYKSKIEIPKSVRRQFSRLAGLLEIADNEFINIRNSLSGYEKHIEKAIETSLEGIDINAISLYEFINTSPVINELDKNIATILKCDIIESSKEKSLVSGLIEHIDYLGIETVLELEKMLEENYNNVIIRVKIIDQDEIESLRSGISILYLLQVLAIKKFDENEIYEYIKMAKYGDNFVSEEYHLLKPKLD